MTESATNRFLKRIVPAGHHLCLARERSVPNPTRAKLSFRHQWIGPKANGQLDKALNLSTAEDDTNWFFGVGGYDNSGRRKAENVQQMKCLLLDVDIGKGDGFFASKADVPEALRRLHTAVPNLPKPWVIDSGYGVHVYYEFDTAVSVARWAPVATLFADVVRAVEPRLIADPVRTKDAASVMRLPASWNAKKADRLRVEIPVEGEGGDVETIKEALASAASARSLSSVTAVLDDALFANMPALPAYMDVDADLSFGKGMENRDKERFQNLSLRPILAGCKQMRDIAGVRGNVDEPLWVDFLRVLNTVAKADEVAVFFSGGHPTSSESGTRRKLRHIRQNYGSATAGCEEFKTKNPSGCYNCPNKDKVWTPTQLGLLHAQETEIAAAKEEAIESASKGETTSTGYLRQPTDAKQTLTQGAGNEVTSLPVRQPGKDASYEREPVMHCHVNLKHNSVRVNSTVVDNIEQDTIKDAMVHLDVVAQGRTNRFVIPTGELTSSSYDAATATLRTSSIVLENQTAGKRMAISNYLSDLVRIGNSKQQLFRPMKGWRKTGRLGEWSFVAGSRHYQPDGRVVKNITNAEHYGLNRTHEGFMERACSGVPVGQLGKWKQGMSIYDGKNMVVAQILLLSGLSNMLMPLLSADKGGIVLALTGDAGAGKTTLLDFMASFMGDHTRYVIPGSSTTNAIGMLLQQANCMMMPVDDTISKDGEVFSALLTMVTGGSAKLRMLWDSKTGGGVAYEEGFNTSLLLTSNYSTTAMIGTGGRHADQMQVEAARSRTLEFDIEDIVTPDISMTDWKAAKHLISTNYGHAADAFLRYVVENQASVSSELRRTEQDIMDALTQQVSREKRGQVRFWSRFLAGVAVTARVVGDKLNLLKWNHLDIIDVGKGLVTSTLTGNRVADSDLVDDFWSVVTETPRGNDDAINFVTRTAHRDDWYDWETAPRAVRMSKSDWSSGAATGGGMQLPSAAKANKWRCDVYDVTFGKKTLWRERTVFIPINELRALVNARRGEGLPVADWSDLYARLRGAGCVVLGVKERRPDKLDTKPVRVTIGLSKLTHDGTTRNVVEIRLPKEPVA